MSDILYFVKKHKTQFQYPSKRLYLNWIVKLVCSSLVPSKGHADQKKRNGKGRLPSHWHHNHLVPFVPVKGAMWTKEEKRNRKTTSQNKLVASQSCSCHYMQFSRTNSDWLLLLLPLSGDFGSYSLIFAPFVGLLFCVARTTSCHGDLCGISSLYCYFPASLICIIICVCSSCCRCRGTASCCLSFFLLRWF